MNIFTPRQQTVHLRQGANEVFREMTKCHFVPHEGEHYPVRRWTRKGLDYQRAMSYNAAAGLSLATRDDFAELCVICRSVTCDKFC